MRVQQAVNPLENRIRLRRQRLMAAGVIDLNDPIWTDRTNGRNGAIEDREVEDFLR